MSKTALLTTASFIAFSAVAQAGVLQEDIWSNMKTMKSLNFSEQPEMKGETEISDSFFIVPLTEGTEETGSHPNLSGQTNASPPSSNLPWNMSDEGTYNRVLEALMEGIAHGAYYALGGSNIAYMATRTTFTFFGYKPGIHEELYMPLVRPYMPLVDPLRETATEYAARIAGTGRFMMTKGVSLAHRGFSKLPYWTA